MKKEKNFSLVGFILGLLFLFIFVGFRNVIQVESNKVSIASYFLGVRCSDLTSVSASEIAQIEVSYGHRCKPFVYLRLYNGMHLLVTELWHPIYDEIKFCRRLSLSLERQPLYLVVYPLWWALALGVFIVVFSLLRKFNVLKVVDKQEWCKKADICYMTRSVGSIFLRCYWFLKGRVKKLMRFWGRMIESFLLLGAVGTGCATAGTNTAYAANALNQYARVETEGNAFEPQYDADGNQTLVETPTGVWAVEWNAENRPVRWTCGNRTLLMAYDHMGRRVRYVEIMGGVTNRVATFFYDGYLCIARTADGITDRFLWDLAESVATRPLAMVADGTAYLYAHDANKNVSEVVNARTGETAAHYDYSAFGKILISVGHLAHRNPFRFSSEYADDATGLTYYNYRHYDPVHGRWLSRDPIEEYGGLGLYVFVDNRFVFDYLGLDYSGFMCQLLPGMGPGDCLVEVERQKRERERKHQFEQSFPSLNIGVGLSGTICFPVAGLAGNICVSATSTTTSGYCCENGKRKTYRTSNTSVEISFKAGLSSEPSLSVVADVVKDLDSCPTGGRSGDVSVTADCSCGGARVGCSYSFVKNKWECSAGLDSSIGKLECKIGGKGSYEESQVW